MNKLAVLIVGYNRPQNVERLLKSLGMADYEGDQVDLLISIDHSEDDCVEQMVQKYVWNYGKKKIYTYPERMGLRKHIIHCGRFLEDYDAIAVLEDDLYVSPTFYSYMKQTVEKYKNDCQIAGISLYTHLWNPNPSVNLPFEPADSAYDVFFMQYAQSWGQIWMKKQWKEFMEWYDQNSGAILSNEEFPEYISSWGQSWLKYHIKYCVEKNRYFVYPYRSFTTCFTDVGEHNLFGGSIYQVPLCVKSSKTVRLPNFGVLDGVYYDVFFERQRMESFLGVEDGKLMVDLYGAKKIDDQKYQYLLTMKPYPYKVEKSFGLYMRPHEENVCSHISGEDIFLYRLDKKSCVVKHSSSEAIRYIFYHRIHGNTQTLLDVWKSKIYEYVRIKRRQLMKLKNK